MRARADGFLAVVLLAAVAALAYPLDASSYPLDGYASTGIARLEAYRLAQVGKVRARLLPTGSLLETDEIELRLGGHAELDLPTPDAGLSGKLSALLGSESSRYGVTLLDLSDVENLRYAEHNAGMKLNPGSVGKILVLLGWFQTLADLYPEDVEARRRLLRETVITADDFIVYDSHDVPLWAEGEDRVRQRPIRHGDAANLYTYLDWMASASSNAAAATLQKHLVLLEHFGVEYPTPDDVADAFLKASPKSELTRIFADAIQGPVARNGLDLESLRQGSFFTRTGKQRIPGTSSIGTSRELMRWLVRLEQGRLVDEFSSLEMKRLLYLTDRRIRYASSPALHKSAVYYKSGSLYSCQAEPGFECKKYHGNVRNYMNSVAIVETVDRNPPLFYMAVVTSNVLRKNSAVAHQTLATRIHRMIESFHPELPPEPEPAPSGADLEADASGGTPAPADSSGRPSP